MRHSIRLPFGALVFAAAVACSGSPDRPAVSADLEQDLAKAGGTDVQLAGGPAGRVDVVSAAERVESPVPAPKARTVSRAPNVNRGTRAAPSPRREAPVAAQPAPKAEQAPAAEPRIERQPEPVPQSRPQAPVPTRQPEPRGGWKTPGEVIRNAPFPINP